MIAVASSILLGLRGAQGTRYFQLAGRQSGRCWWRRMGTRGAASTRLSSQVHIANQCEVAGLRLAEAGAEGARKSGASHAVAAALPALPAVLGPDAPAPAKPGSPWRARDPNTCFFEGQQRPHGARWAPNYDPLCSLCTCQVGSLGRAHWGLDSGSRVPSHPPPPPPAETHGDL